MVVIDLWVFSFDDSVAFFDGRLSDVDLNCAKENYPCAMVNPNCLKLRNREHTFVIDTLGNIICARAVEALFNNDFLDLASDVLDNMIALDFLFRIWRQIFALYDDEKSTETQTRPHTRFTRHLSGLRACNSSRGHSC